jgi:hypothetical protein
MAMRIKADFSNLFGGVQLASFRGLLECLGLVKIHVAVDP